MTGLETGAKPLKMLKIGIFSNKYINQELNNYLPPLLQLGFSQSANLKS